MYPDWAKKHLHKRKEIVCHDGSYYLYKLCRKKPTQRKEFLGHISPEGLIRNGKNITQARAAATKALLTSFLTIVFSIVVIVSIFGASYITYAQISF